VTAKTRLTIDLNPELLEELKEVASAKGNSVEEFCVLAIKRQLAVGKALEPDEVLTELWDNEDDAVYDNI
jgi:hypothetical protein